ncbi:PP2C family protein-serine/threonine phosphatase [Xanthobacter oligotrophicus]|uniref:PP2C family protein-serine/threonine phosphatase n=1 Tax=Xanthobacter oligotrophicus TaxID=2607286 RepID=UPI0011F25461|nr:protein phosphatase 2C domain-containing protein [Xanthobacter oligotrophicus]MCG5233971.1 protein phosphatase 2C domain-containing protein [Xanthobacter oligotrophicus]
MDKMDMVFETSVATHQGCIRTANEDSYLMRPGTGLWAVSDGMGGHQAGQIASSLVVEELSHVKECGTASGFLAECTRGLVSANARLRYQAQAMKVDTIGATVVLLLVRGNAYACIWSGDSRIYRVRDSEITQLTRDHSEAEELVARGVISREEATNWPRRNVVTRAIGVTEEPELEIVDGLAKLGDTFVLCSDGLTIHVDDDEICDLVSKSEASDASAALMKLALERGGRDNVTVVVVRCVAREPTITDPERSLASNWAASA